MRRLTELCRTVFSEEYCTMTSIAPMTVMSPCLNTFAMYHECPRLTYCTGSPRNARGRLNMLRLRRSWIRYQKEEVMLMSSLLMGKVLTQLCSSPSTYRYSTMSSGKSSKPSHSSRGVLKALSTYFCRTFSLL